MKFPILPRSLVNHVPAPLDGSHGHFFDIDCDLEDVTAQLPKFLILADDRIVTERTLGIALHKGACLGLVYRTSPPVGGG